MRAGIVALFLSTTLAACSSPMAPAPAHLVIDAPDIVMGYVPDWLAPGYPTSDMEATHACRATVRVHSTGPERVAPVAFAIEGPGLSHREPWDQVMGPLDGEGITIALQLDGYGPTVGLWAMSIEDENGHVDAHVLRCYPAEGI